MGQAKNYSQFSIELEKKLKEDIFDQDFAVEELTKALVKSRLLKDKGRLRAMFTFIGSPNCGKHYIIEQLVQKDKEIKNIKIFHMDQYSNSYDLKSDQLSTVSFQNEIIEFVKENPNSILFFEDIEKADLQVQLTLYTIFTDKAYDNIDFSNIIAVVTTTVLSSILQRKDLQKLLKEDPIQAHTFLIEKLERENISIGGIQESIFNKKLLSLMNEHTVIPFNTLGLNALIKIGTRSLHNMSRDFISQSGITIEYLDFKDIVSLLTLSLSPYINAKHIKQALPKQIFNYIYEALKQHKDVNNIICSVSKEAKEFLKKALGDKQVLLTKIQKQHKRVSLKWDIKSANGTVKCIIKSASFTQEKLSVTSGEIFHISDIRFEDIAGHKKIKDELSEIVNLFKEPQRLANFDMNIPKGMFLYGPAGMGKKLLSRAFAYEANMPYCTLNGSDLFSESKIREIYAKAYASAPCIIILEDIDIEGIAGGIISTMNIEPLIDELDKMTQSIDSPVFTIMTLSDSANIPEQLLQSNRINISIEVPKLDMEARRFFIEEILKKPHDKNIDIQRVVKYISGMGGNELKRIGYESSLYAARKGLKELTEEILLEQINIIKYGTKLENKQIRDIETSMAKTAYHEAGHAVLSYILLPKIKIEQVTVAPRSESLGFVSYHHDDYIDATSKEELFNDICVLLAGRVAKMEKFGEDGMETGAINDLEVATMQAYGAIALFGMDEELGYINISTLTAGLNKQLFSDKVEERILVWIDKAKQKTQKEVKHLWQAIDAVAQQLILKEVIDGEELKDIIESNLP